MKSKRVIAIEKKTRGDVNDVATTLDFRDETDPDVEKDSGFGTKMFDRLINRRCRPSTLPNAEKLIDDFIKRGSDEIAIRLLKLSRITQIGGLRNRIKPIDGFLLE